MAAVEEILTQAPVPVAHFVLEDFGLDLAVLIRWPGRRPAVKFLELKAFVGSRQGGIGFGNRDGRGCQVDLLMQGQKELAAAQFCRWIVADVTKERGTPRFWILTNLEARNAAMKSVERGKQNNLSVKRMPGRALTWHNLKGELKAFLHG